MRKDEAILYKADNDEAGATADFNVNLLRRCNQELDADSDLEAFEHQAQVNHDEGRVEMHLLSLREQEVRVDGQVFSFEEGETIHIENSCKFTVDEVRDLALKAGDDPKRTWTDPQDLFSIHYLDAT